MTVKAWDYLREYEAERADLLDAVEQVLGSGRLILGPSVAAFEAEFAAYCGVRHGVGVGNATDGLFLALKALGIGAGDEVITVANTAVPTVSAIVSTGATPRFVDVDPTTYLMDVERVAAALTPRTRALLPVHLYGQCVPMGPLLELSRRHGLAVLEDCAQAHGATHADKKAGSFGELGVFSFYPTKVLGGFGDGGMVVSDDEGLSSRLRRLRFYGMESTYYAHEHGWNSRLDELQAELLRRRLARLEGYVARRRELAARYDRALAATPLVLPGTQPDGRHVYYMYVVRHPRRDHVVEQLRRRSILTNVSYPWPIHLMGAYRHLGGAEGDLPTTELLAKEIFSLPLYPSLSDAEQDLVIAAVVEASEGVGPAA